MPHVPFDVRRRARPLGAAGERRVAATDPRTAPAMTRAASRRLPIGAEPLSDGGTSVRVWAPKRRRVAVECNGARVELDREPSGHFSGVVPNASAGHRYRFRLDDSISVPDPASRRQPDGPHGPSEIVDPFAFPWTDAGWRGVGAEGQVIYEMHVGTFTPEGTFASATSQLRSLAELGVTVLEIMPVAEFPGRFGWGYDGVDLFAPFHGYGHCDDMRAFVDRAHREGLGVILDVVYNHFGPDGNYLGQYSDAYRSATHKTDWGEALNFDGADAHGVRELVMSNVTHWIAEYHLDGLRLDATHSIVDDSSPHILTEVGTAARAAAGGRSVIVVAETEPQDPRLVRPVSEGGHALDHIWCDDFHHATLVAATGHREAYFTDYSGSAQELLSALKYGVLYQGQRYSWQRQHRGSAAWDVPRHRCVFYLENHDQVANSVDGRRLHELASPGQHRALTAVLLLAPETPMLFQGQEFGSSAPFLYFADHGPELREMVRTGRRQFLAQFPSIASIEADQLPDPGDPATFERCRLDPAERKAHHEATALHRDLIALRRGDPVLSNARITIDGAVLSEHAFVLRFFAPNGGDRLLVVNLGIDLEPESLAEPLLAPPVGQAGWRVVWSSESPDYGGRGATPPVSPDGSWRISGDSATLLAGDRP